MISMREAFGTETTAAVLLFNQVLGSWDEDNNWIAGGYTDPITIYATPLPIRDKRGAHGQQIRAGKTGERYPASMKFTSLHPLELNDILMHQSIPYKVTKRGDYQDAGFYAAVGQRLEPSEFEELLNA